jgi:two-component system response regulator ResD
MEGKKILIVDDEKNIRNVIKEYAKFDGFETFEAEDGMQAVEMCRTQDFDLIIMDIMMPKLDGYSAVREIRKTKQIPVIMLSARGEEYDKLFGFELGVDDYVTKPFSPKELLARIRALGRRSSAAIVSSPVISCGDVSLDSLSYELSSGGSSVKLGLKEFSIMELLMKNAGTVISKETLITKIWGYESDAEYNNVEVYISFLRKKLSFIKSKATIKTLRGVGYSFSE